MQMAKWCLNREEAEHVVQHKWVYTGARMLSKKLLMVLQKVWKDQEQATLGAHAGIVAK